MELRTSLPICTMYNILQTAMYNASVVHSIFMWDLARTLLDLWPGLPCLLFVVGCSCCITAFSYIVLTYYILHLQGSYRADSVVMSRCYGCCALHIGAGKENGPRYNCCLLIELVL